MPAAVLAAALALSGCGSREELQSKDIVFPPSVSSGADKGEDRTLTIPAAGEQPHGDVIYICPAGGEACTVMVKDGKVTYTSGQPTPRARQRPLDPGGNDVSDDANRGVDVTFTIPAGKEQSYGDVIYICPAGGTACTVVVKGGEVFYTGGQPTARDSDGFTAQKNLKDTQTRLSVSQTVSNLFSSLDTHRATASTAKRNADGAQAKATAAGKMLTAFQVKGDSETAKASAQAVLDAQSSLSDAVVTKVEGAITALEALKMSAEGLAEDAPRRAELIAAIEKALTDARAYLADIRRIKAADLGTGTLVTLIERITDGAGSASAAAWAEAVAQEVEKAATPCIGTTGTVGGSSLTCDLPMNTGGRATARSTFSTPERERTERSSRIGRGFYSGAPNLVIQHDAPPNARTWQEIFGQDKITRKATSTGYIDVVSLEGMDAGGLTAQENRNLDGISQAYRGIAGFAYCLAASCTVTNGTLGAGWYWSAISANTNKRWTTTPGREEYTEFSDFAEYGYWVREFTPGSMLIAGSGYFGLPKNEAAMPAAALVANTALGNTATYTGKALGLSILTAADGSNGRKAVRSGEFTADVTLTATFAGASSKVTGTVNNFRGNAVGSNWSAPLEEAKLLHSKDDRRWGLVTVPSADNGAWHARAYGGTANSGTPTKRPTGLTGEFRAFFPDGRALGGYATRKND